MTQGNPLPCKTCILFAACLPLYIDELPEDIPDPFVPLESIFYFINECSILRQWILAHNSDVENCFREFSKYYDKQVINNEK